MRSHCILYALISLVLSGACQRHAHVLTGDRSIIGTGNVVTITRSTLGFTGVYLAGIGRLVLHQGGEQQVSLTAEEDLHSHLESRVEGGILSLRPRDNVKISSRSGVVWHVTVPRLESIRTDGVVTVEADNIDTDQLFVDMDGISSLRMSGLADRQDIQMSGVATYDGLDLISEVASLTGEGVITMTLNASRRIEGRVCGTGTVQYVGSPDLSMKFCPFVFFKRR